jgi:hypothetical protein
MEAQGLSLTPGSFDDIGKELEQLPRPRPVQMKSISLIRSYGPDRDVFRLEVASYNALNVNVMQRIQRVASLAAQRFIFLDLGQHCR